MKEQILSGDLPYPEFDGNLLSLQG